MEKVRKNIGNIILLIVLIILFIVLQGFHFTTRGLLHSAIVGGGYGNITKYEVIDVDDNNYYCICRTNTNKVIINLIHKKIKFLKYSYGMAIYDIDRNKINNFIIPWEKKWLMFGICDNDAVSAIRFTLSNGAELFVQTHNSFYTVEDIAFDFSRLQISRIEALDNKNNVIWEQ